MLLFSLHPLMVSPESYKVMLSLCTKALLYSGPLRRR
ncbi:hypothetical protein NEOC65_001614 [Neochlamydia sp. AcF65]|nr:hypothetical protein [Neochlamydia sp. AcF65]